MKDLRKYALEEVNKMLLKEPEKNVKSTLSTKFINEHMKGRGYYLYHKIQR